MKRHILLSLYASPSACALVTFGVNNSTTAIKTVECEWQLSVCLSLSPFPRAAALLRLECV